MQAQNPQQQRKGFTRRTGLWLLLLCAVALLSGYLYVTRIHQSANPVPPFNPGARSDSGLGYPYSLVYADSRLDFPQAEGRQLDMDSDTWFLEGVLEGQHSGRRFSFIVVYYVSRLGSVVPFNFYSLTFYDMDNGEYGTFTQYDFGSMRASTGYLDLSAPIEGEAATWTTTVDESGALVPYSYAINLPGTDQNGRKMRLVSTVRAVNPPVAVGADIYNGLITVLKQENTYSYFQTGIHFDGTLTWGDVHEPVKGTLGHIDRQMFPQFSGVNARSWDARDLSHEWRTYFLDNGMDFSSWRQFDRMDRNSEYSYGGATVYSPRGGASYVGDIVYENLSYIRVENHPVKPLMPARADVLYFPDRHRLSSASLDLQLQAEPIVNAPLLAFPVEYMHGPVLLSGTLKGEPITGIGSFEMTLHLYRGFELVKVLSDSVRHLPADAVLRPTTQIGEILRKISLVGDAVDAGDVGSVLVMANEYLRPELQALAQPYSAQMLQILDDLIVAIEQDKES
jgi:predicted secreted hydrolase